MCNVSCIWSYNFAQNILQTHVNLRRYAAATYTSYMAAVTYNNTHKTKSKAKLKKGEGQSLYSHQMRNTEIKKPKNGIINIIHKISMACSG